MGLKDKLKKYNEEHNNDKFKPIELTDSTVQSLFYKCISTTNSTDVSVATLFPTTLGYKSGSEKLIHFDTETLLKNKKNIEYLFGQLYRVHNPNETFNMSIDDYNTTYQNTHWTSDKATLLKLLYLGVSSKTHFITSFNAKTSTSAISPQVKPTLSPKDPNFPAWWEEHKAEWDDKKKGGQEPADD